MTRAFIYTRISSDPRGRRLGVERQEEACRALASVLGWDVVGLYEDNDVSATKEKDPPEYAEMIKACERGEANAIIVLKVDRLHRQMYKFAAFIKWIKKYNIAFATTEGDNTETSNGRFILNVKASMAEAEAERISERVKAAILQRANKGEYLGGKLPYYVENPEAVHWVRDAAAAVVAGRSLHSLARDWNKAGRLSADGNQWVPRAIRRMLLSPSVVGKQEVDGTLYPAPWEPVIDEEVWSSVVAVLTAPGRRLNEINQRKYMLSGLLRCALCGNNLTSTGKRVTTRRGQPVTDGPAFECSKWKTSGGGCGKVKISMHPLERFVTDAMFFVLDTPAFQEALAREAGASDQEIRAVREAIRADEATVQRLTDEYDDRLISEAEYKRRTGRLIARIDANNSRWAVLRDRKRRDDLPDIGELRDTWDDRDPADRREIVSAVIERIDVGPHPRGVSSAPPRRSGEPETAWRARFDAARMATMAERVSITWLA